MPPQSIKPITSKPPPGTTHAGSAFGRLEEKASRVNASVSPTRAKAPGLGQHKLTPEQKYAQFATGPKGVQGKQNHLGVPKGMAALA